MPSGVSERKNKNLLFRIIKKKKEIISKIAVWNWRCNGFLPHHVDRFCLAIDLLWNTTWILRQIRIDIEHMFRSFSVNTLHHQIFLRRIVAGIQVCHTILRKSVESDGKWQLNTKFFIQKHVRNWTCFDPARRHSAAHYLKTLNKKIDRANPYGMNQAKNGKSSNEITQFGR